MITFEKSSPVRARQERNFQVVLVASCGLGLLMPRVYSYFSRFLSSVCRSSPTVNDERQSSSSDRASF